MKHAIALLIALLFSTTGKGQIIVGYSFAQTQLRVGGEISFLKSGGMALSLVNDDGMWVYYAGDDGSIVTDIVLDPSVSGYKVWLATLTREWTYLGNDTFEMPLANGESLFGRRFFAEDSGKYFFRFW